MRSLEDIGKLLLLLGVLLVITGGILLLGGKWLGWRKLPGDIVIKRDNFIFYFPLGWSILISLVLSLLFWLLRR